MAGRFSRDKGKRGELELRDLFRQYGYTAERGGSTQSCGDGIKRSDVVADLPGYWPECKRVEAFSAVTRAYEQAKRDAGSALVPLVFSRTDRAQWLVTMSAEQFFKLIPPPKYPGLEDLI